MLRVVLIIPSLLLLSYNLVLAQSETDYPVYIKYIEGSVYEADDNAFTLLEGSKWTKLSYAYLLPTSDITIILTSEDGDGIAYSDGSEFNVKHLSGGLVYKRGELNLVTESIGNGSVLKMADGSMWEIISYDQYDTGYWLPPYQVIITNDEIYRINFKENKKIWATRIN